MFAKYKSLTQRCGEASIVTMNIHETDILGHLFFIRRMSMSWVSSTLEHYLGFSLNNNVFWVSG